jgi:hypothetical protein
VGGKGGGGGRGEKKKKKKIPMAVHEVMGEKMHNFLI